jgi:hypothetical protein
VADDWYFQMYYDDLPVWAFVGKVEKVFPKAGAPVLKHYLFTHLRFDVKYNEDRCAWRGGEGGCLRHTVCVGGCFWKGDVARGMSFGPAQPNANK